MPIRPAETRRIDVSGGANYATFKGVNEARGSGDAVVAARCSVCLQATKHLHIEARRMRRDVFQCVGCGHRTLHCSTAGCDAMAQGGVWDAKKCAVCSGVIGGWPVTEEEREERARTVLVAQANAEGEYRRQQGAGGGMGDAGSALTGGIRIMRPPAQGRGGPQVDADSGSEATLSGSESDDSEPG